MCNKLARLLVGTALAASVVGSTSSVIAAGFDQLGGSRIGGDRLGGSGIGGSGFDHFDRNPPPLVGGFDPPR